jgi:SNF2 family DNA or RNA helicase
LEEIDIPPWIRIGIENHGFPIFYSLSESEFFEYSPLEPRNEKVIVFKVPVNGVALCDNPGSGKTIVSLALIHSKPFVSLDKIAYDMTAMVPSKATLIICPLQLAEQWRSEAMRCMPSSDIVLIPVHIHNNLIDRT